MTQPSRTPVARTSGLTARWRAEGPTLTAVRSFLLAILVIGVVGTGMELVLLEHTDGAWQWAPLVLLALALPILVWHAAARRRASTRALQAMMLLFILSGVAGLVLHYRGNVEFELEMHPSLEGLGLVWGAMTGATPALAPGTMIQLGLLGLAYTYRHPALTAPADETADTVDEPTDESTTTDG